MLAVLVEEMAKLPDSIHATTGNVLDPQALVNACRGLGRLPADIADHRWLIIAASDPETKDPQRVAAKRLRLGRVTHRPRIRKLAAAAAKRQLELVDPQHDMGGLLRGGYFHAVDLHAIDLGDFHPHTQSVLSGGRVQCDAIDHRQL